jgi:hypothetical protein
MTEDGGGANGAKPHARLDELLDQRVALVKGQPRVPSTTLPGASAGEDVVDEGSWTEEICGAEFGRYTYRHSRMPHGGWRITERHSGANPRLHMERRSTQLELDKDFAVESASYDIESFVGKETAVLNWSESQGYLLEHHAVDGFKSVRTLPGPRRVPSEKMAQSLIPTLGQAFGQSTVYSVDADGVNLNASQITFERSSANESSSTGLNVEIFRLGERVKQAVHTNPKGDVLGVYETTVLLWPRSMRATDAQGR